MPPEGENAHFSGRGRVWVVNLGGGSLYIENDK